MLIPNHPHDERLSAMASGDPDALADASLTDHVASCARCTATVAEVGALRASLAELPDLRPHRPLQLLPPVEDAPSRADALGGWARRFFAPMLTAGAALALVGIVGTTAPSLDGMVFSNVGEQLGGEGAALPAASADDAAAPNRGASAEASDAPEAFTHGGNADSESEEPSEYQPLQSDGADMQRQGIEERSIWPMLIFAGVAIMIAAALLRWILAPRAG